MSELQGILLCSGGGTRMSALTDDIPKCLLPVVGVPMFIYPLGTLLRAGVKDIKIFVREALKTTLEIEVGKSGLLERYPASLEYILVTLNQEDYGTADLFRYHHAKLTHDLLVVSGDFISDSSLLPFIEFFRAHNATLVALVDDNCANSSAPGPKVKKPEATDLIALDENSGQLAYLCSEEDFDGVLVTEKLSRKFPKISLTSKFNDCHVYALRHSTLNMLTKNKNFSSFKADFVPYLIEEQFEENSKITCYAYRLPHENGSVTAHANTIGSYFEVNKTILKSFSRLMPSKGKSLNFNYRKDEIAMSDSRIDENANIGKGSEIKRSIVSEGCKLGEKTKLTESVLLKNVVIGTGSIILHSIICENVEIGERSTISNCIVTKGQKVPAKSKTQNEIVEDVEEWSDESDA